MFSVLALKTPPLVPDIRGWDVAVKYFPLFGRKHFPWHISEFLPTKNLQVGVKSLITAGLSRLFLAWLDTLVHFFNERMIQISASTLMFHYLLREYSSSGKTKTLKKKKILNFENKR